MQRAMTRAVRGATLVLAGLAACDSGSAPGSGPPEPQGDWVALTLAPGTVTLAAGGTLQLAAERRRADGSTGTVQPVYSASGGSVTAGGLFTAPAASGTYRVTATSGTLADTARVIVTDGAAPQPGRFEPVFAEDWHTYGSQAALQAAGLFWWADDAKRDVYQFVELAQDPVMGQVARITFPQNRGSQGSSPRIEKKLPAPVGDLWYRWKMKYEPGWTTVGPDPAGAANSYKVAFFTWESGFGGRGELEFSNSTQYITGVGVQDGAGRYYQYTEALLPGSAPDFGAVSTEWSGGEWWEYVIHFKQTGPDEAVYQYWRRRLTSAGKLAPSGWTYHGMALAGAPAPRVAAVELGCNKNKSNPITMHIDWGPWEVVDGARYPNPFGMPGAQ